MRDALVSIIVPARNYGPFVAAAVQSALEQSYSRVEVIVVDDGSTDDTPQVLTSFGDRIRILRLDGRGVAAARNAGLAAAGGTYVLFLDADDLLLPQGLAHLVRRLHSLPGVGAAYGSWYQCDTRLGRAFLVRSPIGAGPILPRLLLGNMVATPTAMLLRREVVVAAGGFDETLSFTADWELWLRLASRGCRFAGVPQPVAVYRIHARSMSGQLARATRDVWAVLDRYFALPPVGQMYARARADAYYAMGMYLAKLHLTQGDQDGAVAQLRTALAHRPDRAHSLDLYYQVSRAIHRHAQLAGHAAAAGVAEATLDLAARLPVTLRRGERSALVSLGVALMLRHAGEARPALRHLRAALRASPRTVMAPRHLAAAIRILYPPHLASAIRTLRTRGQMPSPLPPLVARVMAAAPVRDAAGIPQAAR